MSTRSSAIKFDCAERVLRTTGSTSFEGHYGVPTNFSIEWKFATDEAVREQFAEHRGRTFSFYGHPSEVAIFDDAGNEIETVEDLMRRVVDARHEQWEEGRNRFVETFPERRYIAAEELRVPVEGAEVSFDYVVGVDRFEVTASSVAALVIADIDGEIDRVITEDEILELTFDADGKTVIRRTNVGIRD